MFGAKVKKLENRIDDLSTVVDELYKQLADLKCSQQNLEKMLSDIPLGIDKQLRVAQQKIYTNISSAMHELATAKKDT